MDGGFSPKLAAWTLIACFLGGVVGIQIVSRIMHHFIPSHVVDCEHSHDEERKQDGDVHGHDHSQDYDQGNTQTPLPQVPQIPQNIRRSSLPGHILTPGSGRRKTTSRQSSYFGSDPAGSGSFAPTAESEANNLLSPAQPQPPMRSLTRRPSLHERMTNTFTKITSGKPKCDCDGPCHGYSDPCGHECFKNINARGGFRAPARMSSAIFKPPMTKSVTSAIVPTSETTPLLQDIAEEPRPQTNHAPTRYSTALSDAEQGNPSENSSDTLDNNTSTLHKTHSNDTTSSHQPDHHHHHVPTNAFLSIGLQTSIAIALHKLPEGFITYATNHANPKLGFSVFLALFIHNITEGFAMALPLYLAINSRLKAMVISFVLGGLSQPIGAAVAAVWFKLAGQGKWQPDETVYGAMFAITAGIMASVALQLFSESLDLTHSRTTCMVWAFCGMGILGVSSALTA